MANELTDNGDLSIQTLKQRIAQLEEKNDRSAREGEQLAQLLWNLARCHFDAADFETDEDLSETLRCLNLAEAYLKQAAGRPDVAENRLFLQNVTRGLANLLLDKSDVFDALDDVDQRLECLDAALDQLKSLEDAGDAEAKFDRAGVLYNRGEMFSELGDFEKAEKDYEEAFTGFRAVEKISEQDTRYYLGKISVSQGTLFRAMEKPLEKIVDAYDRAMRLFVELIDAGQTEHERELAQALIDRCTAKYEDAMRQDTDEAQREKKLADIVVDVDRGIAIFEKLCDSHGVQDDRDLKMDLLGALSVKGSLMLDLNQLEAATDFFATLSERFNNLQEDTDPVAVNQYAVILENWGHATVGSGNLQASLDHFSKAVELREKILSPEFGLHGEDRRFFLPNLSNSYANRCVAFLSLDKKAEAQKDCQKAIELLQSLEEEDNPEIESVLALFESLLEQCQN